MPARSNPFQRLIYYLQLHLNGGSDVAESEMLTDRITGDQREVDVVVRGKVGMQEMIVAFEIRDRTRPATVEWVEQMCAKHSGLPTNQLVLVSSTGFTPAAKRAADKCKIKLVVPGHADEADAKDIFTRLTSVWAKKSALTPTMISISIEDPERPQYAASTIEFPTDVLTDSSGEVIGTVDMLAYATLEQVPSSEAMRDATGAESKFKIVADDPGAPAGVEGKGPRPLYIKAVMDGVAVNALLKRITIEGEASIVVTEIQLKPGEIEGIPYTFGEAISNEGELLALFLAQNDTPETRATLRVGSETATSLRWNKDANSDPPTDHD